MWVETSRAVLTVTDMIRRKRIDFHHRHSCSGGNMLRACVIPNVKLGEARYRAYVLQSEACEIDDRSRGEGGEDSFCAISLVAVSDQDGQHPECVDDLGNNRCEVFGIPHFGLMLRAYAKKADRLRRISP